MEQKLKPASDEAIRVNKLYEDRVNGTISDERFASMSKSYEDEQARRYAALEELMPYACMSL